METTERSGKRWRRDDGDGQVHQRRRPSALNGNTSSTDGSVGDWSGSTVLSAANSSAESTNTGQASTSFFISPSPVFPDAAVDLLTDQPFFPSGYLDAGLPDPFNFQPWQHEDNHHQLYPNHHPQHYTFTNIASGNTAAAFQLPLGTPLPPSEPPATDTSGSSGLYGSNPLVPQHPQHSHPAVHLPVVTSTQQQGSGKDHDHPTASGSAAAPIEDMWADMALFRLDKGLLPNRAVVAHPVNPRSRKRGFDLFNDFEGLSSSHDAHSPIRAATSTTASTSAFLRAHAPVLFPSVPNAADRPLNPIVENPFLDSCENRHPTLANRVRPAIPPDGVIDGYIKIRMSNVNPSDEANVGFGERGLMFQRRRDVVIRPDDGDPLRSAIPLLPPNFATGMKLDKTDEKLWKFHIHAFCAGRTLLPGNYWFDQVAAIAAKDPCARHALLAFSTAYVLDFRPTEEMRIRANDHYRNAVRLLDQALQQQETYRTGSEDGIVAAMILIYSNDIVNWESRRPKDQQPLWREGARAARRILDHSDPGYRYWKPGNVQSSRARIGNANWVAYTDICAQPVTPLTEESTQNLFPWLLEGSKEEVHKIHDATGVCSKLLHMFSQVTYFAALLQKDPESTVVPLAAVRLRDKLKNFRQWSDLSLGYPSVEELFDSCNLDDNGQVNDAIKVTELSAHAWVPAAEIYLHCRVYRKPRSHPHVVRSLKVLIRCIERMPCTGPLFTSQSPFFPVFLMAIASVRPEERKVSRDWFEVVLSGAQCRSSVPPVWVAIKKLWGWLDNELVEEPYDEDQPIGQRRAWWEEMVAKLVEESGVLSLV